MNLFAPIDGQGKSPILGGAGDAAFVDPILSEAVIKTAQVLAGAEGGWGRGEGARPTSLGSEGPRGAVRAGVRAAAAMRDFGPRGGGSHAATFNWSPPVRSLLQEAAGSSRRFSARLRPSSSSQFLLRLVSI